MTKLIFGLILLEAEKKDKRKNQLLTNLTLPLLPLRKKKNKHWEAKKKAKVLFLLKEHLSHAFLRTLLSPAWLLQVEWQCTVLEQKQVATVLKGENLRAFPSHEGHSVLGKHISGNRETHGENHNWEESQLFLIKGLLRQIWHPYSSGRGVVLATRIELKT